MLSQHRSDLIGVEQVHRRRDIGVIALTIINRWEGGIGDTCTRLAHCHQADLCPEPRNFYDMPTNSVAGTAVVRAFSDLQRTCYGKRGLQLQLHNA
jgi:hypothetical protein